MFHVHDLVVASMADRERELRDRQLRHVALASGRRHPAGPERSLVDDAHAAAEAARGRCATGARTPAYGA